LSITLTAIPSCPIAWGGELDDYLLGVSMGELEGVVVWRRPSMIEMFPMSFGKVSYRKRLILRDTIRETVYQEPVHLSGPALALVKFW
jgi:hypothetical protein